MEPTWKKHTQIPRRAYARVRKKEPRCSWSSGNICCHTQRESQDKARVRKGVGAYRRTKPKRPTTPKEGLGRAGGARA